MHALVILTHAWLAFQSPETATAAAPAAVTEETVAPEPATAAAEPATSAASPAPATAPAAYRRDVNLGEEEDESDRMGTWEAAEGARTGGGIGIVLGFYSPDLGTINQIAEDFNFPGGFGDEPLFVNGIRGYGYIGKHFRVGGVLLEGDASVIDSQAEFDRALDLEVNVGGITLEGVYPLKRWEFYGGGMLGVGSYELKYTQVDLRGPRPTWSQVTQTFAGNPDTSTFAKSFSVGYTAIQPWVGVKFKVLPWLALDANAGYHIGRVGKNSWIFSDDSGVGVRGSPDLDASGLTGAFEVTFGFFPY